MTDSQLKEIFNNTNGHCHFCGDKVTLERYGERDIENLDGAWEADHIRQKGKGGSKKAENCLPACVRCNRLRWHREGPELRELILLGLVARDEIKKGSPTGEVILQLKKKRLKGNFHRRRKLNK